jgi:hypothetical protein
VVDMVTAKEGRLVVGISRWFRSDPSDQVDLRGQLTPLHGGVSIPRSTT